MRTIVLTEPDNFDAWRDAARALALLHVPPDQVIWQMGAANDLFASAEPLAETSGTITVSRAFVDLAKTAICHSAPERFALLYTMLWRLQSERSLASDHEFSFFSSFRHKHKI